MLRSNPHHRGALIPSFLHPLALLDPASPRSRRTKTPSQPDSPLRVISPRYCLLSPAKYFGPALSNPKNQFSIVLARRTARITNPVGLGFSLLRHAIRTPSTVNPVDKRVAYRYTYLRRFKNMLLRLQAKIGESQRTARE